MNFSNEALGLLRC